MNLFTRPLGQSQASLIETGCWCNVQWFQWARDSRHLFFSTLVHGGGPLHIYLADSEAPLEPPVDLTPDARSLAIFHRQLGDAARQVLVTQNKRCKYCFDLYQIDLETGKTVVLDSSDRNIQQWFSSRDGILRGRLRVHADTTISLDIKNQGIDRWRTVSHWQLHEDVTVLGFTPNEKGLWLLSNRGRDRIALVRLDLASGAETLIYEDPKVDILSVFISPQTREPLTTLAFPDYPFTQALHSRVRKGLERIRIQTHQGLEILSMDDREALWTVRVFDDRGSYYFLYNQENAEITALGENRFDPENRWASAVRPVQIESRDGLMLKGYLTRPRGVVTAPAPMVLLVHGGPWSRDYWEYDEMVQFLANRGYAVLQINFRGSEGYGRSFKEAAIGEFSGKMHTDLVDAVKWAVEQGIADPAAIAIVGGSYGGYAALVGLTKTPELFACGVAINGVMDVGRFVKRLPSNPPPTLRAGISAWHRYVAHPDADQAQKVFERVSPLYHVEKLTKPVLVVFGERDSRVSPEQSELMIKELKRLNKPVRSLQFMNEGHGITRMDNTCEMFQALEAFLARHLGGRSAGVENQADRS